MGPGARSFESAFGRAERTKTGAVNLQPMQARFTQYGLGIAAAVVGVLIGLQMWIDKKGTPDPALSVLLTAIVMAFVNTFRDQNGYSFGGTYDGDARAVARSAIDIDKQREGQ